MNDVDRNGIGVIVVCDRGGWKSKEMRDEKSSVWILFFSDKVIISLCHILSTYLSECFFPIYIRR